MPSTIGHTLTLSLFGESHGPAVGVVMDGLAPGILLDMDNMAAWLNRRRGGGPLSTARQELDEPEIVSGVYRGRTTGTPLCLLIRNRQQHSGDYEETGALRPGHADYTARVKYLGWQDPRGGGHFSGRLTAPLVAAGAICGQILTARGIALGTHIFSCHGVADAAFAQEEAALAAQLAALSGRPFPVLDEAAGQAMQAEITAAREQGDSVGGILETAVTGLPAGIGEPFFHSVESTLAQLLFSIPAVKGVEFGLGFGFGDLYGSQANDPFCLTDGVLRTQTNHNGGINGGITNGMPLRLRTAVKPTPSIYRPQRTVDADKMEEITLLIQGRHDPAILHRAAVVVDAMVAFGLTDLFARRYGTGWMGSQP